MTGRTPLLPRRAILAIFATVATAAFPGAAAAAGAYDYRTLHYLKDRHTHAIISVSEAPAEGEPPQRGRVACMGVETLTRQERNIARAFGSMFQRSSIHLQLILSSRVCRFIEAAKALQIGPVTEQPLLDPLEPGEDRATRTETLMAYFEGLRPADTALLLADAATVEALTGETLAPGEGLVFTLPPFGALRVRGKFGLPPV